MRQAPVQRVIPRGARPPPGVPRLSHPHPAVLLGFPLFPPFPPFLLELIPMDEIARQNAQRALQRSLDRRDNGGSTGHEK